jgi:hypothetical protein
MKSAQVHFGYEISIDEAVFKNTRLKVRSAKNQWIFLQAITPS